MDTNIKEQSHLPLKSKSTGFPSKKLSISFSPSLKLMQIVLVLDKYIFKGSKMSSSFASIWGTKGSLDIFLYGNYVSFQLIPCKYSIYSGQLKVYVLFIRIIKWLCKNKQQKLKKPQGAHLKTELHALKKKQKYIWGPGN